MNRGDCTLDALENKDKTFVGTERVKKDLVTYYCTVHKCDDLYRKKQGNNRRSDLSDSLSRTDI